jgi:hypothetical protein
MPFFSAQKFKRVHIIFSMSFLPQASKLIGLYEPNNKGSFARLHNWHDFFPMPTLWYHPRRQNVRAALASLIDSLTLPSLVNDILCAILAPLIDSLGPVHVIVRRNPKSWKQCIIPGPSIFSYRTVAASGKRNYI